MEKMVITRRALRVLKSANVKASNIAQQHAKLSHHAKVQRTQHRLKTGRVLWAISCHPHNRIFVDSPPPEIPRLLSSFLRGHSEDLLRFLSTAGKENGLDSPHDQVNPANVRRPTQLRQYNLNERNYLSRLIPKSAKLRVKGLLDMLYTAEELAVELNMDPRLITNTLIPEGLPHTKDEKERIFLHGPAVQAWVNNLRAIKSNLRTDEVYCLGCRKVVSLVKPRRVRQANLVLLKARCPECGSKVNRGVKAR